MKSIPNRYTKLNLSHKNLTMLLLKREMTETVMIGDDIKVSVIAISDGKVILGFESPRTVSVHRKEIYDKINRIK